MLFSIFYEFVMFFVFLALLPKGIYQAVRQKKYRKSFFKRFGFDFPKIQRNGSSPVIWFHAASVGETLAIVPLVKRIKKDMPEAKIIISSTTETGHEAAKRSISFADNHVYLPFDFYLSVSYVLSRSTPDIVILTETDFWFRFLSEVKKRGGVILLASGKVSERSFKSYSNLRAFSSRLFSVIDFFCLQDEQYKKRFMQIGVPESKILVTGNIKGDIQLPSLLPQELKDFREKLRVNENDFVIVVGSSHEEEEEMILKQIGPLFLKYPNLKLILVPRKPERFPLVKEIIANHAIPFISWSDKDNQSIEPKVVLIDAMGQLNNCYQIADIAIVAGSFTDKVGGHNILEPAFFGLPVICGHCMYGQQSLLEIAKKHQAIIQADKDNLASYVEIFINNHEKKEEYRHKSKEMISSMRGVTDKTFNRLYDLVPHLFEMSSCNK